MIKARKDLVTTEDGSLSCFDQDMGELYHNLAGAYTEALKNYVEPSRAADILEKNGQLSVIDVCFGLGYNTFVLLCELLPILTPAMKVKVIAIDCDPELVGVLPLVLADKRLQIVRDALANKIVFGVNSVSAGAHIDVHFELRWADLRSEIPALADEFDLIFHDAFSPRRIPELWTIDLFRHYHRLLATRQGRVLTYSAAGAVRGGLSQAGFYLRRTAALGGKSGGTIASTVPFDDEKFSYPLTIIEQTRIIGRSGTPYRDTSLSSSRIEILKRREDEHKETV